MQGFLFGVFVALAIVCSAQSSDVQLLRRINVMIDTQPEHDLIVDRNGGSADINKGQNGAYVYLQAEYTMSREDAITGLLISIQDKACQQSQDMANGAGGAFRCLVFLRDSTSNARITNIALLRNTTEVTDNGVSAGFDACTTDINKGRGGDFLYLCYNTIEL